MKTEPHPEDAAIWHAMVACITQSWEGTSSELKLVLHIPGVPRALTAALHRVIPWMEDKGWQFAQRRSGPHLLWRIAPPGQALPPTPAERAARHAVETQEVMSQLRHQQPPPDSAFDH